ncbi:MAG: hypothetical protein NZ898_11535, partial [Myxococcota bacterium]|nr:hypothetical protein [Myxococcota bacterium]
LGPPPPDSVPAGAGAGATPPASAPGTAPAVPALPTSPTSVPSAPATATEIALERLGTGFAIARAQIPFEGVLAPWYAISPVRGAPTSAVALGVLPETGRTDGELALSFAADDRDGDGAQDVVVTVRVAGQEVRLTWLDRPAGLARDAAEPSTTITRLVREARQASRRDPRRGLASATAAIALFDRLCREAAAPRLRVGEADGLPCGASASRERTRAALIEIAALVRDGRASEALEAAERLEWMRMPLTQTDRDQLSRTLLQLPAVSEAAVREGPMLEAVPGPSVRLAPMGWLDARTLLLRGDPETRLDAESEQVVHGEGTAEVRILDPSGRFAATGIERGCEGYVLLVHSAAEVLGPVVAGRPIARVPLAPRAPPAHAHCPGDLPEAVRADTGGFHLLGWAPQGVLVARGGQLWLVPLDAEVRPAGPPTPIAPTEPVPAPVQAGAMAPDGSAWARVTPAGIAVHVTGQPTARLYRPNGWDPSVRDVAVAPGGVRVAFLAGGRVRYFAVSQAQ